MLFLPVSEITMDNVQKLPVYREDGPVHYLTSAPIVDFHSLRILYAFYLTSPLSRG
jgi:hypothetical protein